MGRAEQPADAEPASAHARYNGASAMPVFTSEQRNRLAELRATHRVERLELFGSAAGGVNEPNDLDFLVTFAPMPPAERKRRASAERRVARRDRQLHESRSHAAEVTGERDDWSSVATSAIRGFAEAQRYDLDEFDDLS